MVWIDLSDRWSPGCRNDVIVAGRAVKWSAGRGGGRARPPGAVWQFTARDWSGGQETELVVSVDLVNRWPGNGPGTRCHDLAGITVSGRRELAISRLTYQAPVVSGGN